MEYKINAPINKNSIDVKIYNNMDGACKLLLLDKRRAIFKRESQITVVLS